MKEHKCENCMHYYYEHNPIKILSECRLNPPVVFCETYISDYIVKWATHTAYPEVSKNSFGCSMFEEIA